jgi:hypothetical protein
MDEDVKPIEQHGFTIADFAPDKIVLPMFKWDVKMQSVEEIDNLGPFHTAGRHKASPHGLKINRAPRSLCIRRHSCARSRIGDKRLSPA